MRDNTGGKKLKWPEMAESEDNLSSIESEDEEITRILDGRHAKNTIRATKNALKTFSEAVGDVEGLTDKEVLDKRLAKFFASSIFSVAYFSV